MSSPRVSTPTAVSKENPPQNKTSRGVAKSTRIKTKATALMDMFTIQASKSNKTKQSNPTTSKFTNPFSPSPTTLFPATAHIYKHSCHTCNVHFPTVEAFEEHILKSPAHKPFKLTRATAKELGYLNIPEDTRIKTLSYNNLGKPNTTEPTVFQIFGQRASRPTPCKKSNCTCPQFEFTPSHIPSSSTTGAGSFTSLDGAGGSTLYGHAADGDDPENVTISFEPPLPTIVSDEDEPYIPPPDSDEEEVVRVDTTPPKFTRTRAQQDQFEMRKRFAKGKNRKAARQLRKEEKFAANQIYVKPVLEAYVATDEKLFGQKRFEEIDDETRENAKRAQQEAVENWQMEVGVLGAYVTDEKETADRLAEDIDCFIQDILFEIDMQAEEENRGRASERYKKKLFFEDALEDVAIDHEFRLADQDQEKFRKDVGKKESKKLRDIKMGDIVDDIAMDHDQEVGEKEEETHRKTIGRTQTKTLTGTKMGDMVDDLVMDHAQEIGEKEQERHRKTMGRVQGRGLTNAKMLDHVDEFAMDHLQEVGEKEHENYRKSFGVKQTKRLTDGREENLVDSLVMDHLQEVGEKAQEHHRKALGMKETKNLKLADRKEADLLDSIVMDHMQEISEKAQEHDRKAFGAKQTKQLNARKEVDLVDSLVMDHTQVAGKRGIPHSYESIEGHQRRKSAVDHEQDAVNSPALGENRQQKRVTHYLEKDITATQPSDIVASTTDNSEEPWYTAAREKSNTFLEKYLATEETGETRHGDINIRDTVNGNLGDRKEEARHEQVSGAGQENRTTPETSRPMSTEAENNYGSDDGYSSPAPAPKKDRKQLRKEANAKFEAMMEQMVKAQEQDRL